MTPYIEETSLHSKLEHYLILNKNNEKQDAWISTDGDKPVLRRMFSKDYGTILFLLKNYNLS